MQPMLTIALKAARKAGEVIESAFERLDLVEVEEKGRNDFVSEVDRKAEDEVIYHLNKAYPDHKFTGEEGGTRGNPDADYEWIIDPLDGTTNFLHGIPHFAVSVACLYKGTLEHAVIVDPMKHEEFCATRGKGATVNGRRMRVSNRKGMDGALIGTGIPFNGFALEHIEPYMDCLKDIASETAGIRRPGSAALDLAYVAAGRFDGFWEMNLKAWDIAAGCLLLKESGALTSDFNGGSDFLKSGHIVAASPKVFKPLLKTVQKHLGHVPSNAS